LRCWAHLRLIRPVVALWTIYERSMGGRFQHDTPMSRAREFGASSVIFHLLTYTALRLHFGLFSPSIHLRIYLSTVSIHPSIYLYMFIYIYIYVRGKGHGFTTQDTPMDCLRLHARLVFSVARSRHPSHVLGFPPPTTVYLKQATVLSMVVTGVFIFAMVRATQHLIKWSKRSLNAGTIVNRLACNLKHHFPVFIAGQCQ
jgi:hypothetical protein